MKPYDKLQEWKPEDMLEVSLLQPDDFLKVRETLTRIGVEHSNNLYQSCHILHRRGRYYIVHFKELFMLDGRESDFTVDDLQRRNTIATLLSDWGLLELVDTQSASDRCGMRNIKVVPFREKGDWNLVAKYQVGRPRRIESAA